MVSGNYLRGLEVHLLAKGLEALPVLAGEGGVGCSGEGGWSRVMGPSAGVAAADGTTKPAKW